MLDAAQIGRDLMGGTKAMRAAGSRHLPKFESESEKAYEARLNASWLFNGYRKTVGDMAGRVFSKPIELGEGAPSQLAEWSANIDLNGRDLSTFAKEVFKDGLSGSGISFIMVDAPRREGETTQAEAQSRNLRPYMVHLRVEDVLGWRTDTVDNKPTLSQLRIMETLKEPDGEFGEKDVSQIRVLDRTEANVRVRLYRQTSKDEKWVLTDEYTSGASEITVIPFYANRTGFFMGHPLLDDLADVNVAHWQSQSDQRNILHYARVPVLFAAGRNEDEAPIVVSSAKAITASDPDSKLTWVEHSGQAIGAGRQDLKDLEFQMEAFGLQLLVQQHQQSATGEALDAAKETSQLAMTADQLQDALEQAMVWMLEYAGKTGEPSVAVNKEFGAGVMTAQEVTVLLQAVNTGNMSRDTFLRELARRGMVASDLDPEEEAERIDAQAPTLTGEPMGLGDGTGG